MIEKKSFTQKSGHPRLYSIAIGSTDGYSCSIPSGLVTSVVQSGCYLSLTPSGSLSLSGRDTIGSTDSYKHSIPLGLVTSVVQSGCYLSLTSSGSLSLSGRDTIGCDASFSCSISVGLFSWCGTNCKTPEELNVNRQLILIKTATPEGLND